MDVSRRGFLVGAGALTIPVASSKIVLAREAPRQPVKLEGHKVWDLVRPHVLGHLSLEEMAMGLPGPWQEFLSSWWVEGSKVFMPILDKGDFLGAKLNSGYEMYLSNECWAPFFDKWNKEVAIPIYGKEIRTKAINAALLTNINLFRMAMKYQFSTGLSLTIFEDLIR